MTETYLLRIDGLIGQGRQLRDRLAIDPPSDETLGSTRRWQRECAAVVNELSGGSKAHWLARLFSEAFLVRSSAATAAEEVPLGTIVERLLGVLGQAAASVSQMKGASATNAAVAAPVRRFDFVHDATLRPVLEAAYADSRQTLADGCFGASLVTSCSVLEALVTDALSHLDRAALATCDAPAEPIADWPFDARVAAAERAGLIRSGCARLPQVAWRYRDLTDARGDLRPDVDISEREARVAGQVLNVVLRDLDPGR